MGGERPGIVVARLARRQAGAVGRAQLLAAGLTRRQIERLVSSGLLRAIHRGVYVMLGVETTRRTLWWAAALAGGPLSAVSHRDAASAFGGTYTPTGPVSLTVPADRRRRRGIDIHLAALPAGDWVLRDGLRLTSPARTLVDLAAVAGRRELERTLDEFHFRRLVSERALADALGRSRGRAGAPALRAVLERHELGSSRTQTALEERVFELLRAARLGRFVGQMRIGRYRPDFVFPDERVIVEADGRGAHGRRRRQAEDAVRDAELGRRGYEVVRITEEEAYKVPGPALARVHSALVARRTGR